MGGDLILGGFYEALQRRIRNYSRSGVYYKSLATLTGTGAPTQDSLNVCAILIPAGTYDRIAVNVTVAGGVGAVMRLGAYFLDSSGLPGTLAFDAGTVAATTTGTKEITISQNLPEGFIWVAAVAQGNATTPTMTTLSGTAHYPTAGTTSVDTNQYHGFADTGISGALPSTFVIDTIVQTPIAVWLRRV